ncbi:ATP-binding protein [Streptomyces sp. NPDC005181]|uniref:ATP-binding protein n=1 Tax=Streptomyces sp. NPDC005181 TaxID=3156869 RepID=UPI0033B76CA0
MTSSPGAGPDPADHRGRGRPLPFEVEAANRFFPFISGRCERASVIVTSNKPFGRWGESWRRHGRRHHD